MNTKIIDIKTSGITFKRKPIPVVNYPTRTKAQANGLYYHEIGEASKLREIHKNAKDNRDKRKLDVACEYLKKALENPYKVQSYENRLRYGN